MFLSQFLLTHFGSQQLQGTGIKAMLNPVLAQQQTENKVTSEHKTEQFPLFDGYSK